MNMLASKSNVKRFFFTKTTRHLKPTFSEPRHVIYLRQAFHQTIREMPFTLSAISILPDHLHCIWELPSNDPEGPDERWKRITGLFEKQCNDSSPLWQDHGWQHEITDEQDFQNHLDYIQLNPIKQGYVDTAKSWPYSTFEQSTCS